MNEIVVFLIVFLLTLYRTPKLDTDQIDADLEEEEEEGLLANTGRRFNATWHDLTGRAKNFRNYGTSSHAGNGSHVAATG
jgi:LMBR1 domain-containing protein 1